jgi:hypothetical protein
MLSSAPYVDTLLAIQKELCTSLALILQCTPTIDIIFCALTESRGMKRERERERERKTILLFVLSRIQTILSFSACSLFYFFSRLVRMKIRIKISVDGSKTETYHLSSTYIYMSG